MGVSESYARGRELVDSNPLGLIVAAVVVLLLLDLTRQLATGALDISRFAITLKAGVMQGLVVGLAGIGLSMTYSILGFANFAHGDYITSGAFSGWAVAYLIAGGFGQRADIGALLLVGAGGSVAGSALGLGIITSPLAVIVGMVISGVSAIGLALLIDRYVFKPIRDRSGITLLITSIGVAFAIRYLLLFVFGGGRRGITTSQPGVRVPLPAGDLPLTAHDGTILIVSVGLMLGVHLLLQETKLGKAMRAMSDNEDLAQITGIPTERVVRYTWIIGGGLTGFSGFMYVLWRGTLGYFDGWLLLLLIFAAVIMGGIGSIYGAIVGGLVIGLVNQVSVVWLPGGFTRAAAFAAMIVVLVVKPEGIFSGRSTA